MAKAEPRSSAIQVSLAACRALAAPTRRGPCAITDSRGEGGGRQSGEPARRAQGILIRSRRQHMRAAPGRLYLYQLGLAGIRQYGSCKLAHGGLTAAGRRQKLIVELLQRRKLDPEGGASCAFAAPQKAPRQAPACCTS